MNATRSSQAFTKFARALVNFERTMKLPSDNEDCRNSAILSFLLAQETSWKTLQWLLKEKIAIETVGPKPTLQEGFRQGWLGTDDAIWFNMAQDRNLIAHTYSDEQALQIYERLKGYVVALRNMHDIILKKYPEIKTS